MNPVSNEQNTSNQDNAITPWYREFWAWFIFAPLIIVVLACTVTVSIAVILQDDVVIDNYYKEGKALNQNFGPNEQAKELNIQAILTLNPSNDSFTLSINQPISPNIELRLLLSHPAHQEKDKAFILSPLTPDQLQQSPITLIIPFLSNASTQTEKNIFFEKALLASHWYVRLSAYNTLSEKEFWRVQSEANFSTQPNIDLH